MCWRQAGHWRVMRWQCNRPAFAFRRNKYCFPGLREPGENKKLLARLTCSFGFSSQRLLTKKDGCTGSVVLTKAGKFTAQGGKEGVTRRTTIYVKPCWEQLVSKLMRQLAVCERTKSVCGRTMELGIDLIVQGCQNKDHVPAISHFVTALAANSKISPAAQQSIRPFSLMPEAADEMTRFVG
jgi:hypothetical protein